MDYDLCCSYYSPETNPISVPCPSGRTKKTGTENTERKKRVTDRSRRGDGERCIFSGGEIREKRVAPDIRGKREKGEARGGIAAKEKRKRERERRKERDT